MVPEVGIIRTILYASILRGTGFILDGVIRCAMNWFFRMIIRDDFWQFRFVEPSYS
ncbi:hypothetical protein WH47_04404 [Habropoda laboriosa]|uniref:Uncharacterized protein n=1 Tax=Habropoda laboriosa TaxID=597456 RepID=A0A0L7QR85_9HYME|nr:hypothetical protein WH47_04404 [Habropoda laboriosa]